MRLQLTAVACLWLAAGTARAQLEESGARTRAVVYQDDDATTVVAAAGEVVANVDDRVTVRAGYLVDEWPPAVAEQRLRGEWNTALSLLSGHLTARRRCLDVGCGPGLWLERWADTFVQADGFDAAPGMVEMALPGHARPGQGMLEEGREPHRVGVPPGATLGGGPRKEPASAKLS